MLGGDIQTVVVLKESGKTRPIRIPIRQLTAQEWIIKW